MDDENMNHSGGFRLMSSLTENPPVCAVDKIELAGSSGQQDFGGFCSGEVVGIAAVVAGPEGQWISTTVSSSGAFVPGSIAFVLA
jgi:hypothetical protein